MSSDNNQSPTPDELRQQLIQLKISTLKAQAVRMGLRTQGEDISAAALEKIRSDVRSLKDEDLESQVIHWADLRQRAEKALLNQQKSAEN